MFGILVFHFELCENIPKKIFGGIQKQFVQKHQRKYFQKVALNKIKQFLKEMNSKATYKEFVCGIKKIS